MARLKKDEKYVQNAVESLARGVSDLTSYQNFIANVKILFDTNDITLEGKNEIQQKVSKILDRKNLELSENELENSFDAFRTITNQDDIIISSSKLENIKKYLSKKKVVAAGIVLGAGVVTITSLGISNNNKNEISNSSATAKTELNNEDNNKENNVSNINVDDIDPLLNFNPEDKEVLVENIYNLFKDSLPKGHKVTKANAAQEVANWTDAYMVANIENIGPDFLLKYLQKDSKDSLSMIENYLRVVSQVNSDAQVSESSWDLSGMFANKSDAQLVAKFQKIVKEIVSATKDKDKDKIREKSTELRKELEKLVKSNGSRQYSNAAVVMAVNLSFSGANVAKINGMANVVIPSDVRGVVYTDGAVKCIEAARAGKGTLKENINRIGGQDNVYMKAILGLYEEVEKDNNQLLTLYSNMDEQTRTELFSEEMSYNNSQNIIISKVEKILDTYKANKSYIKLYYKNLKVSGKIKTIKKTTTVKSKTAKKISKKKKVKSKDIDSKDFQKGTVTGKDGKTDKTTSKKEQLLLEEANRQGYNAGFNRGNSKGAAGKAKSIGSISVPSKFASNSKAKARYIRQFKIGFSDGYSLGYKSYKDNKDYRVEKPSNSSSKKEESKVYDIEEVKNDNSSSNSSTNSKTEESEVYDIEEVQTKKSVNSKISDLEGMKRSLLNIKNLAIEPSYEDERSHTR